MIVREIQEKDITSLVDIGERMHNSGSFKNIKYNKDKLFKLAFSSIGSERRVWLVAEDENGYIGMMGGFINEYYFSDEKYAADYLIYIPEERRGGKAAIKLLDAFEKWAKKRDVKEIRLGTANGTKPEEVKKFFKVKYLFFWGTQSDYSATPLSAYIPPFLLSQKYREAIFCFRRENTKKIDKYSVYLRDENRRVLSQTLLGFYHCNSIASCRVSAKPLAYFCESSNSQFLLTNTKGGVLWLT